MKHLFSEDGLKILEGFCLSNTLFAFDYDGTLAPIVNNPKDAYMRTSTREFLARLTALVPTAVISGRSQKNLTKILSLPIPYLIGNHGLEGIPGGSPYLESAELHCLKWTQAFTKHFKQKEIVTENKQYSLAIHYRHSTDKAETKKAILAVAAELTPAPRILMGKCVVNLLLPGAPHKGVALLEIMLRTGCDSAIYIGDDDNDEDVFSLGKDGILTIRVGKKSDSNALYFIKSQEEIDKTLASCLDFAEFKKRLLKSH